MEGNIESKRDRDVQELNLSNDWFPTMDQQAALEGKTMVGGEYTSTFMANHDLW